MKEQSLLEYFLGNKAFYLFINDYMFKQNRTSFILEDKYNINAQLGCISNILLSIKEELVSKDGGASARISVNELEKGIEYICKKENGEYKIDNSTFSSAALLLLTIRNKIAHGDYIIDDKKIVLNHEGDKIHIDIEKLGLGIVTGLKSYLKLNNDKIYKRVLFSSNKIGANETTRDLDNLLKSFNRVEIVLTRNDGTKVDENVKSEIEGLIKLYVQTNDVDVFKKFKNQDYKLAYKIESLKNHNFKRIKKILDSLPDVTYQDKINIIGHELSSDFDYNNLSLISANLTNLIMLKIIKDKKTINMDKIIDIFTSEYGELYFNYNNVADIGISIFNSLLSYGKENLFENENIYTLNPNTGFDYSKLDFSKIKVIQYDDEITELNELINQKKRKEKEIKDEDDKINKTNMSLNAVRKQNKKNVEQLLEGKLQLLQNQKMNTSVLLSSLEQRINEINLYRSNNQKYLENLGVVNGIRNSIAHNNYHIEIDDDIKLVFEDIYEGKLTFKCEVDIYEFIELLCSNSLIVKDYIDNKNNQKIK